MSTSDRRGLKRFYEEDGTDMKNKLEKIKKDQLRIAIINASKDPLFLSDIREIKKDFEHADFDEAINDAMNL